MLIKEQGKPVKKRDSFSKTKKMYTQEDKMAENEDDITIQKVL